MAGIFTTKDLRAGPSIATVEAPKIASLRFWRDSASFALLQDAVGVITARWSADVAAAPLAAAGGTFLQHGDAQVLFALRVRAAHHGLRGPPLLCAVVAHRQDLDLAVVLLEPQAVHRCGATTQANHVGLRHVSGR